jgi:hypothetical protein
MHTPTAVVKNHTNLTGYHRPDAGNRTLFRLFGACVGITNLATCRGCCALGANLREMMCADAQFPYLFVWTWEFETFRVAKNHGDVVDQPSVGTAHHGLIQSRRIARLDC